MLIQTTQKSFCIVPRQQDFRRACRQNNGTAHGRIECSKVVHADACKISGQFHIDVARDADRFEVGVILNVGQSGLEIFRLCNDVFDSL